MSTALRDGILNPSVSLTLPNRTGFGQHGDYLFGWDGDSLQRAMDTCTDMGGVPEQCRALTVLSDSEINRCTQKPVLDEVVEGSCKSRSPPPAPLFHLFLDAKLTALMLTN